MDLHENIPPSGEEKKEQGVAPGAGAQGKITDILDEEVDTEQVEENTEINESDFTVTSFEVEKEEPKQIEVKQTQEPEKNNTPEVSQARQKAVSRLFKADTFLLLANNMLGKAGKAFKPNNPDFLKFTKPDREDLGIILNDTAKEENWAAFPAKYLLIFFLILHLTICIRNRNKQPGSEENQGAGLGAGQDQSALDRVLLQMKEMQETSNKHIAELREQNALLKGLLDKKVERDQGRSKKPTKEAPERYYKGIDLEGVQFTEAGARIFPEMAGKPGYSKNGVRMGTPPHSEKDLFFVWKRYQEWKSEHVEEVETEEVV